MSGRLLSYTSAMSSDTFCFVLLPEASLSVQKTQDPKKKSKPQWPEDLYKLSCLFTSFKTVGKKIFFCSSERDPRGKEPQVPD